MRTSAGVNGAITLLEEEPGHVAIQFLSAPGTWAFADIFRVENEVEIPVRGGQRVALNAGDWVGEDFEVPLGVPFDYRVRLYDTTTGASVGWVDTYTAGGAPGAFSNSPERPGWLYLHNVTQPATLISPNVESISGVTREAQSGVYAIIGRSAPVVVAAARGSRQGTLTLVTRTLADRDALWAMFETGDVLLARTEPDYGVGSMYLALNNVTEDRITRFGWDAHRRFTLEFVETERPVGTSLTAGNNSWQAVLTGASTWQVLLDLRASWTSVYVTPIGSSEEGDFRGDVPDL